MPENADDLLRAWYRWWEEDDRAPVKMPYALHVRTALYLRERTVSDPSKTLTSSSLEEAARSLGPDPGTLFG